MPAKTPSEKLEDYATSLLQAGEQTAKDCRKDHAIALDTARAARLALTEQLVENEQLRITRDLLRGRNHGAAEI